LGILSDGAATLFAAYFMNFIKEGATFSDSSKIFFET
jgi:hypothetical protein